MLARHLVVFLLVTGGGLRGETAAAVVPRLTEALKAAHPYVPPVAGEGKTETGGGPTGEPRPSPRLVLPAETTPSAGTPEPRKIPRLGADIIYAESLRSTGARPGSGMAGTKEPQARASEKQAGTETADTDILVLPAIEVTARKVTELETRLADVDQQQRSEEKFLQPSWLDLILNPPFFGGGSAEARAALARKRVEVMRWERILLVSLETAITPEERARIEADIIMLRDIRRLWG